jgi:hypothetical protein
LLVQIQSPRPHETGANAAVLVRLGVGPQARGGSIWRAVVPIWYQFSRRPRGRAVREASGFRAKRQQPIPHRETGTGRVTGVRLLHTPPGRRGGATTPEEPGQLRTRRSPADDAAGNRFGRERRGARGRCEYAQRSRGMLWRGSTAWEWNGLRSSPHIAHSSARSGTGSPQRGQSSRSSLVVFLRRNSPTAPPSQVSARIVAVGAVQAHA